MAFAVLKAPAGCSLLQFGLSLAACGDELLVGSPYRYFAQREDENIPPPACALFHKSTGGWTSSQLFVCADPALASGFGRAVTLGPDLAAIGAPGDEAGDVTVQVFRRGADGTFSLAFELDAPGRGRTDELFHEYGSALAGNDRFLFVGAPLEDGPAEGSGAVHIFSYASQSPVATLRGAHPHGNFGAAIAVSGEMLVVGAPGTYSNEQLAGSVHIFSRLAEQWQPLCEMEGFRPGEGFGSAVAIDGNRLLVGAPGRTDLNLPGRADLFAIEGRQCTRKASLDGEARFASAVALQGDRAVVGSPAFGSGETTHVGRAGLFRVGPEGRIEHQGWLVGRNAKADAGLGTAVALGPGYVAAGAPGMVEDTDNSGFVIVADF